ncbi:hypothetical protein PTTG_26051 [Puccinia triticina 1-1 BBBD Race 1]|uniref:DUF6589 domain-containing protein n=1 Tax=Puccinia triticina (isolate 1-1 / race 1 (BBBD)) TaxID=630390 RepID=A0A180GXA0_PUCT1|nr:hypothetical protein PTTG_26051 [Puccinia triticina 1-1 BBBD Race 1]
MDAFNEAMKKVPSFQIKLRMFQSEESYKAVWKSQIARVLHEYIAQPQNPPPVEKISSTPPEIQMFMLMDASENSAKGMGQVLDSIALQTGLNTNNFFGCLQLMDGDLATCRNFNCLRSLRTPSRYAQHSLHNIHFQLSASHTLWNIASSIFKAHFGDNQNSMDTGAWRCLEALGIPNAKAFPKKDFSLMINHIEKVHEATILFGLKKIMGTEEDRMNEFDPSNPRPKIPTSKWNSIIDEFYNQYCTGQARHQAAQRKSPKLHNLLIQLQEFSTVVEANQAMKSGDIGRHLNTRKTWSVMSQLLKGLRNYSSYLPFSPSGRENHFVAKDFYLKLQNYWLKFFFNQTGTGTQVERLKRLYSMNIQLLRDMMHSIRLDTGATVFTQTHKNVMTAKSLNVFLQMANSYDILGQSDAEMMDEDSDSDSGESHTSEKVQETNDKMKRVANSYLLGYKKIQKEIGVDPQLSRFKLHMPCSYDSEIDDEEMANPTNDIPRYEL